MDFSEKIFVTMIALALLAGLFGLDQKIDRKCAPPVTKTRVAV